MKSEINIYYLLIKVGFASSRSKAKRMILGNGIKINGTVVTNINKVINLKDTVIQFGKNMFKKIVK